MSNTRKDIKSLSKTSKDINSLSKTSSNTSKEPVKKAKKILLRVSDNLYDAIDTAIQLGIADNTSEFVRRCVVNQLLDLNLLGVPEKKEQ
ncbi:MAG: hypothetical protein ACXAEU_01580 [Candidatus Hodarchaeales archaeon]|jgi:hypothetical protein